MPLRPGATGTKGVPATECPQDFTFPAPMWDMPSATTIKLLGVKMVRNLLPPLVGRDGTPLGDVVDEIQTVLGQLPADEANRATHSLTQLLTRVDAKIAQVQTPINHQTPNKTRQNNLHLQCQCKAQGGNLKFTALVL